MMGRACSVVAWSWIAVVAGCGDNATRMVEADAGAVGDPTRVRTIYGELQGTVVGSARQFLGIAYAQPPIGALRWQAPREPGLWSGTRDATAFSKRCAQLAAPEYAGSVDEDCLYLNVWTPLPERTPAAPLPVMIWIHGGGHVNGSASEPEPSGSGALYSGQFLAERQHVVVVSINYRLGVFGFFAHPDLEAEGNSGNQGLLDQRMAMQWVKYNITAFGGDAGNVTIFGDDAGAVDVCLHGASSMTAGLFHRAIAQSGGCTAEMRTQDEAAAMAMAVTSELGCPPTGGLACLRRKSAVDLMASPAVTSRSTDDATGFGPEVDGQFLRQPPRDMFGARDRARVPYMFGSNTDEGTRMTPEVTLATEDAYVAALTAQFGSLGAVIEFYYQLPLFTEARPNPAQAGLARAIGDFRVVCPTVDSALRLATLSTPTYLYNFDIPVPDDPSGRYLGATHGAEVASVFGTSPVFTAETRAASDRIQRYWTNFARTGDPNGGADLRWPVVSVAGPTVRLNLGLEASLMTGFRDDQCHFWLYNYSSF